jgi:hypothetical protein
LGSVENQSIIISEKESMEDEGEKIHDSNFKKHNEENLLGTCINDFYKLTRICFFEVRPT